MGASLGASAPPPYVPGTWHLTPSSSSRHTCHLIFFICFILQPSTNICFKHCLGTKPYNVVFWCKELVTKSRNMDFRTNLGCLGYALNSYLEMRSNSEPPLHHMQTDCSLLRGHTLGIPWKYAITYLFAWAKQSEVVLSTRARLSIPTTMSLVVRAGSHPSLSPFPSLSLPWLLSSRPYIPALIPHGLPPPRLVLTLNRGHDQTAIEGWMVTTWWWTVVARGWMEAAVDGRILVHLWMQYAWQPPYMFMSWCDNTTDLCSDCFVVVLEIWRKPEMWRNF
jgi:hypothetical protein